MSIGHNHVPVGLHTNIILYHSTGSLQYQVPQVTVPGTWYRYQVPLRQIAGSVGCEHLLLSIAHPASINDNLYHSLMKHSTTYLLLHPILQ
jgi:hypothetical protein